CPRSLPNEALQLPDGTVVYALDSPFHPVPWKATPGETMGAAEVDSLLTDLAVNGNMAASTQNQALAAILFLYRQVLDIELPWLENITRAKRSPRVPVVLTKEEPLAVLAHLDGSACLVARLMYGSGLRLTEALRLRIKDVD